MFQTIKKNSVIGHNPFNIESRHLTTKIDCLLIDLCKKKKTEIGDKKKYFKRAKKGNRHIFSTSSSSLSTSTTTSLFQIHEDYFMYRSKKNKLKPDDLRYTKYMSRV